MKVFDVVKAVNWKRNYFKDSPFHCFAGSVGEEVKKVSISHKLTTRPHTFSNGEGEIAETLTIVINFNDAVIQPHSDFEDAFCEEIVDQLGDEVNGLFENAYD